MYFHTQTYTIKMGKNREVKQKENETHRNERKKKRKYKEEGDSLLIPYMCRRRPNITQAAAALFGEKQGVLFSHTNRKKEKKGKKNVRLLQQSRTVLHRVNAWYSDIPCEALMLFYTREDYERNGTFISCKLELLSGD